MIRPALLALACLLGAVCTAQAQPQFEAIPVPDEPAAQPVEPPPDAAQSAPGAAPAVLPQQPRVRALDAVASGAGGMSYCGPAGAMTSGRGGGTCAVTCPDRREHAISCPAGTSALCQCEREPYASCRGS